MALSMRCPWRHDRALTVSRPSPDVELKKCERRAALHLPLSAATSPEGAAEPEPEQQPGREPEPMVSEQEPRPSSRLTAALNESADLPAKLMFLERLGLRPVTTGAGAGAGAGAGVQARGSPGTSSAGGSSPSGAASTSSGGHSPTQRKSGEQVCWLVCLVESLSAP